jgi:hypothetical protein
MGQIYRRLVIRAAAVAVITLVFWALYATHGVLKPGLRVTVVTASGRPVQGAQVLFLHRHEDEVWSTGPLLSDGPAVRGGVVDYFEERSRYAVTDAAGKARLRGQFDRHGYRWRPQVDQDGLLLVVKSGFLPGRVRFGGAELGRQILDGTVTLTVQLKRKAA